MQGSFGGETFTFSLFLVLCNRLTTMSVAITMLLVRGSTIDWQPPRLFVRRLAAHRCRLLCS